ncbi:hypothetical protein L4F91_04745 [Avibacterium sp. 20-126]|uniref:hypothetical protein n=1 Tax=Avibacterium sp. 20-126 TaxID=2911524 RepID=UPI0021876076|nr:hypothetical protein L4F91_04745 [Avibacterium sp. 20-126]
MLSFFGIIVPQKRCCSLSISIGKGLSLYQTLLCYFSGSLKIKHRPNLTSDGLTSDVHLKRQNLLNIC